MLYFPLAVWLCLSLGIDSLQAQAPRSFPDTLRPHYIQRTEGGHYRMAMLSLKEALPEKEAAVSRPSEPADKLVPLEAKATSVVLLLPPGRRFEELYLMLGSGDSVRLRPGHQAATDSGWTRSQLVMLEGPSKLLRLRAYAGLPSRLALQLMYAPPVDDRRIRPQKAPRQKGAQGSTGSVARPATIPQESWRAGLPDPRPNPQPTPSQHLIVHHTAGSNTDTQYVEVVRNIYLFHLQGRGWDDIGYNFLIAQNGWIFEGRDGQGVADDDRIRGAHFCGKNSYTMGVAVLGNYQETFPPYPAGEALSDLLAWKADKEALSPYAAAIHPPEGGGSLPVIAGHRDGCATVCPGDLFYPELPRLRDDVARRIGVPVAVAKPESADGDALPFDRRANGKGVRLASGQAARYSRARLISADGRTMRQWQTLSAGQRLRWGQLASGWYWLVFSDGQTTRSYRLWVG